MLESFYQSIKAVRFYSAASLITLEILKKWRQRAISNPTTLDTGERPPAATNTEEPGQTVQSTVGLNQLNSLSHMKTLQSSSSGSEVRDSNVLWFESLSSREKCSLTLFCFPYAGGSSQIYRNWQGYVPPDISVCLIHLPGRGKRINERPFTKLNTLVEALADAIADQLQRPFAFFGHSMGALICFELAREIRRRHGRTPSQVFASGRRAPQLPSTEPPSYDCSDEEFIAALKRLNGTPPALLDQIETRNLFMPVLRADFEIVDTYSYVPDDPLPCPISVYGGLQDHRIPVPDLRAWEKQTSANCTVRMFVGDHFFINNPGRDFFSVLRRDVLAARR